MILVGNDADGSIVQNTIYGVVWYGRYTISIHTIQCPELLQQFGKALYHGFDFTLDILFFYRSGTWDRMAVVCGNTAPR